MQIRSAVTEDAPALARVMIEANVQAFRGLVPDRCLEWITPQESAANWKKTLAPGALREEECLLVAEEAGTGVVGFALAKLMEDARYPRYRAELRIIAVDPSWQRRGIGLQLVRAIADHLTRFEINSLLVRVLKVNPNCGFYEHLGAKLIGEQEHDWNGMMLSMNVYAWRDVTQDE
jgi:GNAT superfamily N-acetyltransferase